MSAVDGADERLWAALCESEAAFVSARMRFFAECQDRIGTLRAALHVAHQRGTALRVLGLLDARLRLALLPDLIHLASVSHGDIVLCRELIASIPKTEREDVLRAEVPRVLDAGGEEEYRRLLELLVEVDSGLATDVARAAASSVDSEIRDVGEEFLGRLNPGGTAAG